MFVSLAVPIPLLFANFIREISNEKYALTNTAFGSSITYTYYLAGVFIALNSFLFISLAISNSILLYEFKNYILRKQNLTSINTKTNSHVKSSDSNQTNTSTKSILKHRDGKEDSKKRLTKMVLTLSVLFMASRLIQAISTILSNLDRVNRVRFNAFTSVFAFCALLINYIVYGSCFLYHSYFNKTFFDAFKKKFLRI